jgi:hypothetical protein
MTMLLNAVVRPETARSQNRLRYGSYTTQGSNTSLCSAPNGEKKFTKLCDESELPLLSRMLTAPLVDATTLFGPAAIWESGGNEPVSATPRNEVPKAGVSGCGPLFSGPFVDGPEGMAPTSIFGLSAGCASPLRASLRAAFPCSVSPRGGGSTARCGCGATCRRLSSGRMDTPRSTARPASPLAREESCRTESS